VVRRRWSEKALEFPWNRAGGVLETADSVARTGRLGWTMEFRILGPEMAEETRALLDGGDLGDAALGARAGAGFQMGQPARAGGAGLPAGSRPGSCEPDGPGGRFGNSHPGPDIYTV
jgi:hypothetical protein